MTVAASAVRVDSQNTFESHVDWCREVYLC